MFVNKALLPSGKLRQAIYQVVLSLCKSPVARDNESSSKKKLIRRNGDHSLGWAITVRKRTIKMAETAVHGWLTVCVIPFCACVQ